MSGTKSYAGNRVRNNHLCLFLWFFVQIQDLLSKENEEHAPSPFGGKDMTNHEKQQLKEMRSAGAGCVRIAEELELSVNSVKSFCRRHGLERNLALCTTPAAAPVVQTDRLSESVPITMTAPCEQCGAPVTQVPARKKKRFCSDACRMASWYRP